MRSIFVLFCLLFIGCSDPGATEKESQVSHRGYRILPQKDQFERRAAELAREGKLGHPAQAPVGNEPRTGSWTGSNQLGNELPFEPDANNRQTILKLDEWGYPEIWTVSLGIKGFPQGTFDRIGIRAIIEYGAGGITQTVVIDWRNGSRISLPMNAVNVIAEFYDIDFSDEGQGLFLSVQLSRKPRGFTGTPTNVLTVTQATAEPAVFPVGTILEQVILPAASDSGLCKLPEYTDRIMAVPAGLTSDLIAAFYSDDFVMTLFSGNDAAPVALSTIRGSDLRFNPTGIQVFGSARFARFYNLNETTPIVFSAYAEIDG